METYCQNCKQQNPPDALFCRQCASPLAPGQGGGQRATPNQGYSPNQQWSPQNPGGQTNFAQPAAGASGRAIAALALTVCGLILCCGPFTGIPGAILGWMEMGAIRQGQASPKGMMMAQIALWGGIGVSIVMGLFSLLYFAAALSGGMYY